MKEITRNDSKIDSTTMTLIDMTLVTLLFEMCYKKAEKTWKTQKTQRILVKNGKVLRCYKTNPQIRNDGNTSDKMYVLIR